MDAWYIMVVSLESKLQYNSVLSHTAEIISHTQSPCSHILHTLQVCMA